MKYMLRYYSLSAYLGRRFRTAGTGAGRGKVWKIPLDAGGACPNRDGTVGTSGCVFCNPRGSGSGLAARSVGLAEQWEQWRGHLARRHGTQLFLAYLQSFSNTHGPLERLAAVLAQVRSLPGCVGLCVGTRPDCLDRDKLALLAAQPFPELWLELGLQSASDATLARIGRGHDAACFADAARLADAAGLKVCAHVMAGLPGEGRDEFLRTLDFVDGLPVRGLKLHNLYVAAGSPLARIHAAGGYDPLDRGDYLDWLAAGLARLRPDIVIHRLNADPAPGELVAPAWAADKRGLIADARARLERDDTWQGKARHAPDRIPAWFDPAAEAGPEE